MAAIATHRRVRDLTARFLAALAAAQAERPNRPDIDPETGECEWVAFERQVLLEQVNTARTSLGLPPVTVDDVARVEQRAVGHSDYTPKFALYCAELALRDGED